MSKIGRTYRKLRRSRQIITILARYGFGDLLSKMRLRYPIIQKIPKLNGTEVTRAERLRMAFEELGPTFIKLGQLLSLRPDLIQPEFARELSKLQDEAPPVPFEEVRERIESEFGCPLKQVFTHFDEQPLAAASLAQVHRARIKEGDKVVAKIQRPKIQKSIKADIGILYDLAHFIKSRLPASELYDSVGVVKEFDKTIRRELDFAREGRNMDLFRRNFAGDETIYIPKVYWKYTTPFILVMEYVDGIKISELEQLEEAGLDRKTIAKNGANTILKQVFEHGLFHADPHPGNVLILEDNVIVPIDYGMVGRLDEELQKQVGDLLTGVVKKDVDRIVKVLKEIGSGNETLDLRSLKTDLSEFIDRYYQVPLYQLDVGKLMDEGLKIVRDHRIRLPSNLVMMGKALMIEEGVGRVLYPEFDMITLAKPYVKKLLRRRYDPRRQLEDLAEVLGESGRLLKEFPSEFRDIVGKIRRGGLRPGLNI